MICSHFDRFLAHTEHEALSDMLSLCMPTHLVPGSGRYYDLKDLCAAMAPRPLACNEGGSDEHIAEIRAAYAAMGAEENFSLNHYPKFADPAARKHHGDVPLYGLSHETYFDYTNTDAPMYEKLCEIYPTLTRIGCRIPMPTKKEYGFTKKVYDDCWWHLRDAWSKCVLECLGLPLYFSYDVGGATFLEGDSYLYSDEDVMEMLARPLFIASDTAKELCERGFGKYMGVDVTENTDTRACYERIGAEKIAHPVR